MQYIDLFAGMGGFRTAFGRQGFKCVFSSEYDPKLKTQYPAMAYEILYGDKPHGDITKIDEKEIPDHDILCGGFPCQAFSIAGKQEGFRDIRGTLFFDIARIAKEKQPRLLVLENVKGLLSHEKGETFFTILKTLDEIGYDAEWCVLNTKNFGIPQNRERTYIIGHLRDQPFREIFPIEREVSNSCKIVGRMTGVNGHDYLKRVYSPDGLSPTLPTGTGGGHIPKIIVKNHGRFVERDHVNCLDANYHKGLDNHGQRSAVQEGDRVRMLTPLECFRLQGFPDEYYHKLRDAGFSDTQLYRLSGNAVSVDVVEEIAGKIRRVYF